MSNGGCAAIFCIFLKEVWFSCELKCYVSTKSQTPSVSPKVSPVFIFWFYFYFSTLKTPSRG